MTSETGAASPRSQPAARLSYLAVFVLALLPRLVLFPWFRDLVLTADEAYYWKQSSFPFLLPQFRPPLWPFVLKLARLFSDEACAGRLFSVVLGSLFVVLLFALAERLFDRRTAWIAALIGAFCPELVVWSHFLFAETLFSSLLVLACLALFPRAPESRASPWVGCLLLGLALLAKEFAVVMFAALATTQLLLPGRKRIRTVVLSSLLFVVPNFLFWGALSLKTGKLEAPYPAAMANAQRASNDRGGASSGETSAPGKSLASVASATRDNFKRLWGSTSFVQWRLGSGHYGKPAGTWLLVLLVLVHGCLLAGGLIGIVCEPDRRWRSLAFGCIVFLSLTAIPLFLVSRFRLPFMFLFLLGTARVLAEPRRIRESLVSSRARTLTCAAAVVLIAALLLWTFPDARHWG